VKLSEFSRVVGGVTVRGNSVPLLVCESCGHGELPALVDSRMDGAAREAKRHGLRTCDAVFEERRFGLCEDIDFLYSSLDWEAIPGVRQSALELEGYYTPVFFEPRVLAKYMMFESYALNHYDAGGKISFSNGFELEYGINRNGKVFCWLGDLEKVPRGERHHLRSENIPSDHDVVSGLYKKSRLRMAVGRTREQELTKAIRDFAESLEGTDFLGVFAVSDEALQISQSLARPVIWDRTIMITINDMSKLCVESFNKKYLKASIRSLDSAVKIRPEISKILDTWLNIRFQAQDQGITNPFYVINTWRNALDHVWSESSAQKINECYKRTSLHGGERTPERLYGRTVEGLIRSFRRLTEIISTASQAPDVN